MYIRETADVRKEWPQKEKALRAMPEAGGTEGHARCILTEEERNESERCYV